MSLQELSTVFSTEAPTRRQSIEKLKRETFDLAIIGGGINGAGVARDAASRGLKVAVVEARDFASGTSSRSSKLIHGGIRYLESLEFGLVFEALSERARLFEMAPHLVHPLRFIIPMYKSGRVPVWKMGLGMIAYDILSLFDAPELHRYWDKLELTEGYPLLQTRDLEGGFSYSDAYMDDDRLVLETMRSAQNFGATVANYVRAQRSTLNHVGKIASLECEDVETGVSFSLRARHFVSCVGPWTDRMGESLFDRSWKSKLRPSKGVHLTFLKERFPLNDAVVMGAEERIVFAIPRHEMVIVGTTDTDFSGDPSQVRTEPEDVRYLLNVIDTYFPGVKITERDIVGCYAGVRPLVEDGSVTESKTSREHAIWTEGGNVTFVAGGKYTTYRHMSEQTVNEVLTHFSVEEQVAFSRSRTLEPLNSFVTPSLFERANRECASWPELPTHLSQRLAERHGMEARRIIEKALKVLPAKVPRDEEWMWCAEALHAVDRTMCLHLADFFIRRTPLILSRPDHGARFVKAVGEVMASTLNWSEARLAEEINALQNQINRDLAALS